MVIDRKNHWENIYDSKKLNEVSWYQSTPETSLQLITNANISKSGAIIDVGGGDSFLVDNLLKLGYTNITVLDISSNAIERAKNRLGNKAELINWIVTDVAEFNPDKKYVLWHDRAVFHFLTADNEIKKYKTVLNNGIAKEGNLIIGTFSETGPDRCSGINIKKYSKEDLTAEFISDFDTVELLSEIHSTPFDTTQNFSFAHLKHKL